MKRITILFMFILLGYSASDAGQFLATTTDVAWQVRRKFDVDTSSTSKFLSADVANALTREAIVTVNPLLRGIKSVDTVLMVGLQDTYTLDTLTLGVSSVEWINSANTRKITYRPRASWGDGKSDASLLGEENPKPQHFDYTETELTFYPPPIKTGDTMIVSCWKRVGDIDTVTVLTFMPEAYRVVVMKYVTWAVALAKQHPLVEMYWRDYESTLKTTIEAFGHLWNEPAKQ